jgi:uncharacterized protein (TIGR04255 family)
MVDVPQKLKKDGIVEALFEVRFTSPAISEVYLGRLVAGISAMKAGLTIERLPMANLPFPMRRGDPNLAFQPTLQLKSDSLGRIARIGEMVVSWHALAPYPGWELFSPEINQVFEVVVSSVDDISIVRLGFRYLNLLNATDHQIQGLKDLTLDVLIGGETLDIPLNVAYQKDSEGRRMAVRIATPEFVQTATGPNFSLLLDIDVNTDGTSCPPTKAVIDWVEGAHTALKQEFFTLLKPEILHSLIEDS